MRFGAAKCLVCGNRHLLEVLSDPSSLEQQSFQVREVYYPCDWVRVQASTRLAFKVCAAAYARALVTFLQFAECDMFVPILIHLYNRSTMRWLERHNKICTLGVAARIVVYLVEEFF